MSDRPTLFLDNALSPRLAQLLQSDGIDAIHLRSVTQPDVSDEIVLRTARESGRVLVSFDTDFGGLLATTGADQPSVILFRTTRKSTEFVRQVLNANLLHLAEALSRGAVAVIEDDRIRIRSLPIDRQESD